MRLPEMTPWEKKIRQEICDDYCQEEECSHRGKEEKCMFNKDIRDLVKSEIKKALTELSEGRGDICIKRGIE